MLSSTNNIGIESKTYNLDEFKQIVQVIRPYTLLSEERLFSLYSHARQICMNDLSGNFVECGSFKGGAAALLGFVIKRYSRRHRKLYAFDTFAGMPQPTEVDRHNGIPANDTGFGFGTLQAPIEDNIKVISQLLNVEDIVIPVQGLFADTLPKYKSQIGQISLLHADGDWYESTMDVFNNLYKNVVALGIIQVDDYGHWEGCRKALHDFEKINSEHFILHQIDYTGVYFQKSKNNLSMENKDASKHHILLYTDDPGIYGVGQYNHAIIKGAIENGYRVSCIQSRASNCLIDERIKLGVRHFWLESPDFSHSLSNENEAQQLLEEIRPDLIIFSNCCPLSNFAAKKVAAKLNIPYLVTEGFVGEYLAERFSSYLSELGQHYDRSRRVIAVSGENLQLLQRHFHLKANHGQVIYYGKPSKYFQPINTSNRTQLRQELCIPEDAVVCFTSARLETVKGYQYQLDAIAKLKDTPTWKNLYFVWAGDGSLMPEIQKNIFNLGVADRVKLLGIRADIDSCLDIADIFILPSQLEGMPHAIMEAMAKGLPVIASRVSGIPEELGDTGKLIADPTLNPEDTITELVDTLHIWVSNSNLRQQIGASGRARASQLFTENRMIRETLEAVKYSLLPIGDYVSPGLEIVRPDRCFPNMIPGNTDGCGWTYLRREIPHNWYVDQRQPIIGFLSRDEAHIVYNTAKMFSGQRALEIGCWLGWSACHLALAGVELDVVDPFLDPSKCGESVDSSLKLAGVRDRVHLHPGYSPAKVEEIAAKSQRKWPLIFIDGNHEAPGPLDDAIACARLATDDAIVLFHDLASPDVAQGLDYFKAQGWNTMVYQTMQIMGVAWRGNVRPLHHIPDPHIQWELPAHLQDYVVSGMTDRDVDLGVNKLPSQIAEYHKGNTIYNRQETSDCGFDVLIVPEIKNDEFYTVIQKLSRRDDIHTVLEIGSSSGAGSTEAFVTGLRENPNHPTLYCMEVSKARFTELNSCYTNEDFVKCYNLSSIAVEKFPDRQQIIDFYYNTDNNLIAYPLELILGWLKEDIEYVRDSGVNGNGIAKIKQENQIDYFDLVLIDGSEFTGSIELAEVYGAKYICLDDITTYKNHKSHCQLLDDPNYYLLIENTSLRNGYSVFKKIENESEDIASIQQQLMMNAEMGKRVKSYGSFHKNRKITHTLTIEFFTIVLNGQPFIKYHIDIFKQLPFKWHWHIVEGVADLKHDTGWSVKNGGRVAEDLHDRGRSNDGTTEYLDELARLYPDNITLYRKPEGVFWDGKREMVNAPLANIQEECLLWQVDVDEFWTLEQLIDARQLFINNPQKTAAFYWCWYFVGDRHIISTRNCYAQNPNQEWLRTWRYKPGAFWAAHEPPMLVEPVGEDRHQNIASVNPFSHQETEERGLVFQHFAYTTPEQLQFKEKYYGYTNAVTQWEKLQQQTRFPVLLRDYFAWVGDSTQVNTVDALGIVPLAQKSEDSWKFLDSQEVREQWQKINNPTPRILIDGVFFQLYNTGIARVWKSLLEEWVQTSFAKHIIVLDRANTAPKIPGVRYYQIPAYDYNNTVADRQMLQQVCDELDADLFISTYYTTPLETPSVFMGYDMIPEVLGFDLNQPMWQEKQRAIAHASAYVNISEHTAKDLLELYSNIDPKNISVAHCGVSDTFQPASPNNLAEFRYKYGITKPYFIISSPGGYKNTELFLQAIDRLPSKSGFDIVVTGGHVLSEQQRQYIHGCNVHYLRLDDFELSLAYAGAIALVYPSKYEGFGLPIVEAMASGCPVITCPNASIPEVAGEAAIYVFDEDVDGMAEALCEVQKPQIRSALIAAGLEQAQKFSWTKMADTVKSVLLEQTLSYLQLRARNLIIFPDWSADEEALGEELTSVLYRLSQHPEVDRMTLIVDTSSGEDLEAMNSLISAVAMNLMMAEGIDITESLVISLTDGLTPVQWEALLPKLEGKIKLELETIQVIDLANPNLIKDFELPEVADLATA